MSDILVGLVGLAVFFVFLALRMPVGLALTVVGFGGVVFLNSWAAAVATLTREAFVLSTFFELSVIPLFILMGNFAGISGMSRDLYAMAYAWIGHWRGGLASATVVGCAGFAALSGSSVASAVTMGRVSLPEMDRYNYDPRLSTGAVAAGGTIGILIPPSTGFVVYAVMTEESIGRLFIAGVVPGLLLTTLFVITVSILTFIQPKLGPAGPSTPFAERIRSLIRAVPIVAVIVITIGGIYGGIFTPVEAAGVGAFLMFVFALMRGSVSIKSMHQVLLNTVRTTAMSFLILIGAHVFSPFLALSQIPRHLGETLIGLDVGVYGILAIILVGYILLGTFMEGFAMMVLTLPIVFPLIVDLGLDPIWFGVVLVVVMEMGLITPPVGVNVFVVKAIAEHVPMSAIFAGITPFWVAMLVCLILLVLVPELATALPDSMFSR